jgi:predicted TIM-barrel fold metal-dependent hydrolase
MQTKSAIQYKTNLAGFNREAAPPRFALPAGACDSHMHIVGPLDRYPLIETRSVQPAQATLADYRRIMEATGLERAVVVQPSWYARDCECTLDATAALGDGGRAVVVVSPDVDESTLANYHARGARGVRLQNQVAGGTSVSALPDIAARIAPFGWHVQIFVDTADLVDLAPLIRKSPVPVVIDHMAHLRGERELDSPGLRLLFELMDEGRVWVKLSNTRFFPDAGRLRALVAANPQRVLWGSDWPHVAFEEEAPTLGALLDRLGECVPDEATRRAILSDNPQRLYFESP